MVPDDPELEVTLLSVCWMDVNTPRLDSTKKRNATATNSTTQATSDMRKLNFITDHGSSRATTSSARRAGAWPPGRAAAEEPPSAAPAAAPPAAAPAARPEPPLYRPRVTAANVEVRLRPSSAIGGAGLSVTPGLLLVLPVPVLPIPVLAFPVLPWAVLPCAVPPAGSVSVAGYGGTADVASPAGPAS